MTEIDKRLLLLHAQDNVLVCCRDVTAGTELLIDGKRSMLAVDLGLGHKIARRSIARAEKIIRAGVSIGSATEAISVGQHVHVHNMKSDYIATHLRDAVVGQT